MGKKSVQETIKEVAEDVKKEVSEAKVANKKAKREKPILRGSLSIRRKFSGTSASQERHHRFPS